MSELTVIGSWPIIPIPPDLELLLSFSPSTQFQHLAPFKERNLPRLMAFDGDVVNHARLKTGSEMEQRGKAIQTSLLSLSLSSFYNANASANDYHSKYIYHTCTFCHSLEKIRIDNLRNPHAGKHVRFRVDVEEIPSAFSHNWSSLDSYWGNEDEKEVVDIRGEGRDGTENDRTIMF